jgi:hypothetical protein
MGLFGFSILTTAVIPGVSVEGAPHSNDEKDGYAEYCESGFHTWKWWTPHFMRPTGPSLSAYPKPAWLAIIMATAIRRRRMGV